MHRKITPDIETLQAWNILAQDEYIKEVRRGEIPKGGHPVLQAAMLKTFVRAYIKGRIHQWQVQQEVEAFARQLEARDN